MIRELVTNDHLPDYHVGYDEVADMVIFTNRGTMSPAPPGLALVANLRADTYDEARAAAPGWDVYYLEKEWRDWIVEPPRDADAAFVGFCRKWFEKRGHPA